LVYTEESKIMLDHFMIKHSMIKILSLLIFCLLAGFGTVWAGFPEDYDKALKVLQSATTKAEFEASSRTFEELTQRSDAGALKANALYWLAEAWYGMRDYLKALNGFEKVMLYPQSNKEEPSRFKVAACYARLGLTDSARWEFSRFLRDYPSSNLVKIARDELSKLPSNSSEVKR
jgi:TolA-binding protein